MQGHAEVGPQQSKRRMLLLLLVLLVLLVQLVQLVLVQLVHSKGEIKVLPVHSNNVMHQVREKGSVLDFVIYA
jgi:lipoprotein signal peptidase